MQNKFILLIADKNRNVREFLRREFVADGYIVIVAKDYQELVRLVKGDRPPDLLIFDLEMPFSEGRETLEELQGSRPSLPVVVHTFLTEHSSDSAVLKAAAFLEKKGSNIDRLKEVVIEVLKLTYPDRFALEAETRPRAQ